MSRDSSTLQRLHIGCGPGPQPAGWVHLDGSWNARFAKAPRLRELITRLGLVPERAARQFWQSDIVVANIRRRLPFPADSFDVVYSSHVLEHLYQVEANALLRECVRVLRRGGVLRIVVPDLKAMVVQYLNGPKTPRIPPEMLPADWLNEALHLRTSRPPTGFVFHRIYLALTEFHTHKWMYDAESLAYRMNAVGLAEVAERPLWNSRIGNINEIENPGRLADGAGVCVEGVKS